MDRPDCSTHHVGHIDRARSVQDGPAFMPGHVVRDYTFASRPMASASTKRLGAEGLAAPARQQRENQTHGEQNVYALRCILARFNSTQCHN